MSRFPLHARWLTALACLFIALAAPAQDETTYRLGPGDQVRIDVLNEADLSGEYTLDGSGRFSMHLIGSVQADGMSPSELEAHLIDRLRPDYLVNPRVSVEVLSYRPFYIIGEVSNPGSYAYVDGMTYLNAVALAGGYTYRAKEDIVFVRRPGETEDDEARVEVHNRVRPGDIIRVAERLF